jgi:hypothetical protein
MLSRYNVDCKPGGGPWQANAPPRYPNDLAKSGIAVYAGREFPRSE